MIEPTRKHDAAYPWVSPLDDRDCLRETGMTKREVFASQMLAAMLANPEMVKAGIKQIDLIANAIDYADRLIDGLNEAN